MSKELIKRLRADAESTDDIGLCADAADLIEAQQKRIQHLEMALADTEALEIGTAERLAASQAQIKVLREAISLHLAHHEQGCVYLDEALAATPEQSLARIRNQVREECALEADRQFEDEPYGHAKFRCANIALEIRAMKEAE